jgi:hypothetical protein
VADRPTGARGQPLFIHQGPGQIDAAVLETLWRWWPNLQIRTLPPRR